MFRFSSAACDMLLFAFWKTILFSSKVQHVARLFLCLFNFRDDFFLRFLNPCWTSKQKVLNDDVKNSHFHPLITADNRKEFHCVASLIRLDEFPNISEVFSCFTYRKSYEKILLLPFTFDDKKGKSTKQKLDGKFLRTFLPKINF